ncbi:hypothetical protein LI82_00495 [Methanococcoides methylutens]|uniref:Uncharacterized protein n=2 Tax=Methanococcoides methylutens TaxID=2226 RepID=A0A099T6G3_METMT|nr:hypothetical protein [Methanococcoides methylutens]KGK99733.1 hypothetical protein LI82_00495 [Methanococcoides methylutens]
MYTIYDDHILIPYTISESDLSGDGTEVELIATYDRNIITIQMVLAELDEDEQLWLDPMLMHSLLAANFELDICKFGFSPYGLSLLVDLDARNLQCKEVESGIDSIFDGFATYLEILNAWFVYLIEMDKFLPLDYNEDEELYLDEIYEWIDDTDQTKNSIVNTLLGVAKYGAVAGIATLSGVPAAGIGAILAALASTNN